jgi:hypothetical protein
MVLLLFKILSPVANKPLYALRKKCLRLIGKSHMNQFIHFLVTGKLIAHLKHLSVNPSGDSPKGLHHGNMEGVPVPQSAVARQQRV